MEGFKALADTYIAIGAAGLIIVVFIWLLINQQNNLIKQQNEMFPLIQNLVKNNEVHTEVIRNNTGAIQEVSRSNENVAKALLLLRETSVSQTKLLEKHDQRAEAMENKIIEIEVSMRNCKGNIPKHNNLITKEVV